MKAVAEQHAGIDRFVANSFAAQPEMKSCCSIGCSACCSEPLYVAEAEVLHIIECLTPQQIAEVKIKLVEWLAKTKPLMNQDMPDAFEYRKLKAPCVLLKNGLCSVYPRRPMSCRVWFALSNPQDCELPARQHQKYAIFSVPKMFEATGASLVFVNDRHVMDHLGVLLAEHLLGVKVKSASRKVDSPANIRTC